jgi:hypothetical protein
MSMRSFHKRMTYEDKFDRKFCCYWKRGAKKIKRYNRKLLRRKLKSELEQRVEEVYEGKD